VQEIRRTGNQGVSARQPDALITTCWSPDDLMPTTIMPNKRHMRDTSEYRQSRKSGQAGVLYYCRENSTKSPYLKKQSQYHNGENRQNGREINSNKALHKSALRRLPEKKGNCQPPAGSSKHQTRNAKQAESVRNDSAQALASTIMQNKGDFKGQQTGC